MTKKHVDQFAIVTSALCAVHCALLPFLISLGVFTSLSGAAHHTFEIAVFIITAVLGSISIYNGLRGHGRMMPQIFIGIGAIVIMMALLLHTSHYWMALGGLILSYGHWSNWRRIA